MLHGKKKLGKSKESKSDCIFIFVGYLLHGKDGSMKEGDTVQCISGEVAICPGNTRLDKLCGANKAKFMESSLVSR